MTTEDLRFMIYDDLGLSSPELDEYVKCIHTVPYKHANKYMYVAQHNSAEKCNTIIRYYDDGEIARAYCVYTYDGGIGIMYDRESKMFSVFVIGEDDGNWFPVNEWNFSKDEFVTAYIEAFAIFNENFKE